MGIKKGTKLTDNPKEYILRVRMDNYACKAGCDLQRAGRNTVTSNP
ncbi:MAG: hypothetical protein MSA57_01555 [Ruminococcus sp.]|nr:hypothetical protein [Ruminococcus sp.]